MNLNVEITKPIDFSKLNTFESSEVTQHCTIAETFKPICLTLNFDDMYTPINWANPNNLELIKEKRVAKRIDNSHATEMVNTKKSFKPRWLDFLNRAFVSRLKLNFEM